jgi:hypothetical protein
VALDHATYRHAKGPGGDLFRDVLWVGNMYQGVYVVSPESGGKLLVYSAWESEEKNGKSWKQELLDAMDEALKSFGPVSKRSVSLKAVDPFRDRGAGVRPDGSVCLALYLGQIIDGRGQNYASDNVTLSAKEWDAFRPPRTDVGTRWSVPDHVATKFGRALALADTTSIPSPEDLKVEELKGVVESTKGGQARVRLAGRWEAPGYSDKQDIGNRYVASATAEGIAIYDLRKQGLISLLMVFSGKANMNADLEDGPVLTGAVVEWRSEEKTR